MTASIFHHPENIAETTANWFWSLGVSRTALRGVERHYRPPHSFIFAVISQPLFLSLRGGKDNVEYQKYYVLSDVITLILFFNVTTLISQCNAE